MTNMQRIDTYPTHTYGGYKLRPGRPFPFGATSVPGGVNFSIYSAQATSCTLVLFRKGEPEPMAEIVFPAEFRIGNVFSMVVFDLDYESTEYGYRMEGPYNPKEGHRFDQTKILMDPYARAIGGRDVWGAPPHWNDVYPHRSRRGSPPLPLGCQPSLQLPLQNPVNFKTHCPALPTPPPPR